MTELGKTCPSCKRSGTSFLEGRLCAACLLQLAVAGSEADTDMDGSPGAEERYVVRALIDDSEEITAYLAEDSASVRLVRLEVGKKRCGTASAEFKARVDVLRGVPPAGTARVLDGGLTEDGRAWLAAAYSPAPAGERRWLLTDLGFLPPPGATRTAP